MRNVHKIKGETKSYGKFGCEAPLSLSLFSAASTKFSKQSTIRLIYLSVKHVNNELNRFPNSPTIQTFHRIFQNIRRKFLSINLQYNWEFRIYLLQLRILSGLLCFMWRKLAFRWIQRCRAYTKRALQHAHIDILNARNISHVSILSSKFKNVQTRWLFPLRIGGRRLKFINAYMRS